MTDSNPQIYIRGFPKSTKQKDLETLFEKFGKIKQARIVNAYAFIGFENEDSVKEAVKEMNEFDYEGSKLKVQIAGKPKKQKGPQPTDQCRYCSKLGHWKNSCPQYRRRFRDRDDRDDRRRRRSSSSDSSSSSDRHKKKKRSRRRSPSSDSDSSNSSSSSSSRSRDRKKKVRKQKNQNGKKQE